MSDETRLLDLLCRWEELRAEGHPVTAEELCRDAPELLGEVQRRLRGLRDLNSLLETPCDDEATVGSTLPATAAGARYRPVRFHARGGLGEVLVAEDAELHREVALKRIQAQHRRSEEGRRRFLREAEITARLEHPGIVPVYGLIQEADGPPCYAMRFIQGETLQEAIRRFHEADVQPGRAPGERSLSLRQLLNRFVSVCNTIAYAHSRGILHRDLKPANIMLGQYGETLVVDWGLAKSLTDAEAADSEETLTPSSDSSPTDDTATGQTMGTPAYMSPEQAEGRWDRVGPASDIYSLGATLTALLTGQSPLQGSSRPAKQPIPPALRAVCRKAMAPRPEDRYATATELAAEIEHWLADEPVSAWPEPWRVRAGRWVKRHRTLVTSAAAVLLATVVLLTGAAYFLNTARKRQEAVTHFLLEIFSSPDPGHGTRQQTIVARLDAAAERLDQEFADDPVTRALLYHTLGHTYFGIGQPKKALSAWEKCHALREAALGADHPDTIAALNNIAAAYHEDGHLDKALPLYEKALRLFQAKYGPDHRDSLIAQNNVALAYQEDNRLEDALRLFEDALPRVQAKLGPDEYDTLIAMHNLAAAYQEVGRLDKAVPLFEDTLQRMRRTLGDDHRDTLNAMNSLAEAYRLTGKLPAALSLHEETLKRRQKTLGHDHRDTHFSMHNLATVYLNTKRLAEAVSLYEQTLERRGKLDPAHPDTLNSMNSLATAYILVGRLEEALALYEKVVQRQKLKPGPDHPDTLLSMSNLAEAYRRAGRSEEAVPLFEDALKRMRVSDDPNNLHRLDVTSNLARAYLATNRFAQAEPLLRECLTWFEAKRPAHWSRFLLQSLLGASLAGQKKYADAEPLLLAGYEGLKARDTQIPAVDKHNLAAAAERLVKLYEALEQPEKAATWRAEHAKLLAAAKKPSP